MKGSLSSGCANRGREQSRVHLSERKGQTARKVHKTHQASALAVALCSTAKLAAAETCCAEKIGMAIEAALLLIIIFLAVCVFSPSLALSLSLYPGTRCLGTWSLAQASDEHSRAGVIAMP